MAVVPFAAAAAATRHRQQATRSSLRLPLASRRRQLVTAVLSSAARDGWRKCAAARCCCELARTASLTHGAARARAGCGSSELGGIKDGWFSEVGSMWPGQAMSLKARPPPAPLPSVCDGCRRSAACSPRSRRRRLAHAAPGTTGQERAARGQVGLPRRHGASTRRAAGRATRLARLRRADHLACRPARCSTLRRTVACSSWTAASR